MLLRKLTDFIVERHRIYERRRTKERRPWTRDPILAQYRFCNVYRELDRVTMWITTHWRNPHRTYPHLWFAMVVARLVNHPPTLERLSLPGRWNAQQFLRVVRDMKAKGEKTFGSAYIISTNGIARDKALYLVERVFDPLWEDRERLFPRPRQTLREFHEQLMAYNGMGNFITAQVIADIKYVQPLAKASDWWTFAASGPGSRRGLNRVIGIDKDERWNEQEWHATLMDVAKRVAPIIKDAGLPPLHAQDLQNCLCEFDKYERARLGEGRPKQNFIPHEESHA